MTLKVKEFTMFTTVWTPEQFLAFRVVLVANGYVEDEADIWRHPDDNTGDYFVCLHHLGEMPWFNMGHDGMQYVHSPIQLPLWRWVEERGLPVDC
jgi:hypothetical protein